MVWQTIKHSAHLFFLGYLSNSTLFKALVLTNHNSFGCVYSIIPVLKFIPVLSGRFRLRHQTNILNVAFILVFITFKMRCHLIEVRLKFSSCLQQPRILIGEEGKTPQLCQKGYYSKDNCQIAF